MDPYKERARFSRLSFGTKIEASLEVFSLLLGHIVQAVQHFAGHIFLGIDFKEAIQLYGFGHDFKATNCGDRFVAVRYFSWLEIVSVLL
jgi:hypothetical protein